MRRLNKIYYAILYNMHIVCQITSSTIQLYAKRKEKTYECFILGKHTARNGVAGISPPRREFQKC